MLIENVYDGYGTGFLVSKPQKEDNTIGKVFLVTNKHVIGKNQKLREDSSPITLHLNVKDNGTIKKHSAEMPLIYKGIKYFREHPSMDVDVLAFENEFIILLEFI